MAEKPTSTSSADYEVLKRSKIVQWAAKDALLTEKIRRQEAQQSKGPKLFGKKIKVVMPFPMTLLLWRILPYMCGVVVLAVVFIGFYFREKAYFSAGEGAGYALGVVGTCMICALFLYPLRKRVPMMKRLGDVKIWFGFHMLCGVLGPVVILFHANFSLGPVKSTIALLTMVIVIVSGVVGHYLYMRTHDGL
ncbi:MAG: hypothetical protein JKY45_03910 [Emcibacter sp.]|nr:hypothetical protein [Emcibacter sp.]